MILSSEWNATNAKHITFVDRHLQLPFCGPFNNYAKSTLQCTRIHDVDNLLVQFYVIGKKFTSDTMTLK